MSRRSDLSGKGDLSGKVVVVTGAARGLGAALAGSLAARGARLALVGLEPEMLAGVAAAADARGGHARWWRANVTDEAALRAVAAAVVEHFGRVDVVVANAGIAAGGTVLVADPASYDRVIEVNLLGSVRTARAFLPHLVAARGYLLQIASAAAIFPTPGMSAYGASKSGVEAFAHALAAEVVGHGVDVGVAYLSWTDTDMVRGASTIGGFDDLRASLPYPLDRIYPLEPAVERIATGIERRAAHVYGQPWLRATVPVRGLVPPLLMLGARRLVGTMRRAEDSLRAADPATLRPVGPGGAADAADVAQAAEAAAAGDGAEGAKGGQGTQGAPHMSSG